MCRSNAYASHLDTCTGYFPTCTVVAIVVIVKVVVIVVVKGSPRVQVVVHFLTVQVQVEFIVVIDFHFFRGGSIASGRFFGGTFALLLLASLVPPALDRARGGTTILLPNETDLLQLFDSRLWKLPPSKFCSLRGYPNAESLAFLLVLLQDVGVALPFNELEQEKVVLLPLGLEDLPLDAKGVEHLLNPRVEFAAALILLMLIEPRTELLTLFSMLTGDIDMTSPGLELKKKAEHDFKAFAKVPVPAWKLLHSTDLFFRQLPLTF